MDAFVLCPLCNASIAGEANGAQINAHIDECLQKTGISDLSLSGNKRPADPEVQIVATVSKRLKEDTETHIDICQPGPSKSQSQEPRMTCPFCQETIIGGVEGGQIVNAHIDNCLNRNLLTGLTEGNQDECVNAMDVASSSISKTSIRENKESSLLMDTLPASGKNVGPSVTCPLCNWTIGGEVEGGPLINKHLDECLSRATLSGMTTNEATSDESSAGAQSTPTLTTQRLDSMRQHLNALAEISDILPRFLAMDNKDNTDSCAQTSGENMSTTTKSSRTSGAAGHLVSKKGKYRGGAMAKGVGYSSYTFRPEKSWVKGYLAANKKRDEQLEIVLGYICAELKRLQEPRSFKGGKAAVDSFGRETVVASDSCGSGEEAAGDSDTALFQILDESALVPFITSKLQANSLLEIGQHSGVYRHIVALIQQLSKNTKLCLLLGPLQPKRDVSIHSLLEPLEQQANVFIYRIEKANCSSSNETKQGKLVTGKSNNNLDETDELIAKMFQNLATEVGDALQCANSLRSLETNAAEGPSGKVGEHGGDNNQGKVGGGHEDQENKEYVTALKMLQIVDMEFSESGALKHHYLAESRKGLPPSRKSIARIAKDIACLQGNLPLNASSSIFVRNDDNNITLLRVIITGPEGTPYTGGIYEFDVFFPQNYPSVPPKVHFRTTGGGKIRFNPNLYAQGKVCLSLLGTWSGEKWNQDTSTILQVLVSIQSLILCPEPYFNEPGYQSSYGTASGKHRSAQYNEEVLKNSMNWAILEPLRRPPPGFEDVVQIHFYLRRNSLIEDLEKQSRNCCQNVRNLVSSVVNELASLQKPAGLP